MSLASLTEVYHHMRFEHSSSAAGVSVATAIGTIEFDGLGNYSTQLNRRSSDANGNLSTEPSTVRTGTYIIGRSGKIRIDGATTPSGAVAGDSSILFWVETLGATAALNVAVRQAPGAAPAKLTGDWSVGSSELRVGTDTGLPQTVTRMINVLFAGNGDLSGAGTEVQANPTDNSITALQFGGSWLWSPAGNSNLSVDLPSLPLSLDARLGANGNYMLGMSLETDRVGAIIGLRNCPATAFGSATAGTNDEPTLGLYGGYPVLGNNLFGLALTNGRANSLFTLGIATVAAPPPGRPFLGGTLWIDLDSLIYAPSAALDDLGRGIASLPLPADPSFDGIELYAQGAVFDPIAPGGLALTKGLGMRLCN